MYLEITMWARNRLWCYNCHETNTAHKWPLKLSIKSWKMSKRRKVWVSSTHEKLHSFVAATSACLRGRTEMVGLHVSVYHFKASLMFYYWKQECFCWSVKFLFMCWRCESKNKHFQLWISCKTVSADSDWQLLRRPCCCVECKCCHMWSPARLIKT